MPMTRTSLPTLAKGLALGVAGAFAAYALLLAEPDMHRPAANGAGPQFLEVELRREFFCTREEIEFGNCAQPTREQVFNRFNVPAELREATLDLDRDQFGCIAAGATLPFDETFRIALRPIHQRNKLPVCP